MRLAINIDVPEGTTMGDLLEASGAVLNASTTFVDWEKLASRDIDAISLPGHILLAVAKQLTTPRA